LHPGMMFVAFPFKTCFACGDWATVAGSCEGRAKIARKLRGPARQACAFIVAIVAVAASIAVAQQ
jgi:hypothetical protein